jgi:hypothetical protein
MAGMAQTMGAAPHRHVVQNNKIRIFNEGLGVNEPGSSAVEFHA